MFMPGVWILTMKGLDTVESLSAGAARLKVQYPWKKYWHYFHCPKNVLSSILSFIFWIFVQSNAAVVTSSKNLYIGPLVSLRRPRGFRHCRAPSWLQYYYFWKFTKQIIPHIFKSSTPTTVYLFLLRNLWEVTMPLSTFQPLRGTLPGVRKFGEANGKYQLNVYGKVWWRVSD